MSEDLNQRIPGNVAYGIIRNQELDIGQLPERIRANEFLECRLSGTASREYGQLGPNLISCEIESAYFPTGVSHFDAKDSTFIDVRVQDDFTRIMVTRCVFKSVRFTNAKLRDTVFLDSHFEDVCFEDCDLSVAVFKSNMFVRCTFRRCVTDNKLFEHCVFDQTVVENLRLQEMSVLQNFGLRSSDMTDVTFYTPEAPNRAMPPERIRAANALERVSLHYYLHEDLATSEDLWEVVNLRLGSGTHNAALHLLTALEQMSRFLLLLFGKGELRAHFLVELFWSLDRLSDSAIRSQTGSAYVDRIQSAIVRLRPVYEQIAAQVPPTLTYDVLVAEDVPRWELEGLVVAVTDGGHVASFERYNSPSVARLTFDRPAAAALFAVLVLAIRFKLDIDTYRPAASLLAFETKLLPGEYPRGYAALIAMNMPGALYGLLKPRVPLSVLERLHAVVLRILSNEESH